MTAPAMDMVAYAELKEIMEEVLDEIIEAYLETIPGMLETLQTQIQNKNTDQVFEIAHLIKSSSSSIGAVGMAKTAEIIELAGREGTIDNIAPHMEELKLQYKEVESFLTAELSN